MTDHKLVAQPPDALGLAGYEGVGTRMAIGGVVCVVMAESAEQLHQAFAAVNPQRARDFKSEKCLPIRVAIGRPMHRPQPEAAAKIIV